MIICTNCSLAFFRYKDLLCNSDDFLIHGDLWANNCMFDEVSECILVDWQFTAVGNPLLDFGTMAYLSMDPKGTNYMPKLLIIHPKQVQRLINLEIPVFV